MNDDFEYALPTEVARLMAAPVLETGDALLLEDLQGDPPKRQDGAAPMTSRGSLPHLQSLVATQPVVPGNWAEGDSIDGTWGPTIGPSGCAGSNSAPLAGTAADPAREGSLGAQSDEPGSTIVVAPYDLTQSSRATTARRGTMGGTISTSSGESPGSAATASDGVTLRDRSKRALVGGTIGCTINSVSNEASADSRWTSGTLPAVEEARPVIHGIRMGRMHEVDAWECELSTSGTGAADGDGEVRATQRVDHGGTGPRQRRGAMAPLLRQLDCFGRGHLFLGRFELLGRDHRRRGGAILPRPQADAAAAALQVLLCSRVQSRRRSTYSNSLIEC